MRILVLSPVFPPYKGGMGAAAAQQVQLLRNAGHEVRVMTPHYAYHGIEDAPGITWVKPWFSLGNGAILPFGVLWRAIRASDAVYLHYPFFGTAGVAAFFARCAKKRLVVFLHMRAQAKKGAMVHRVLFALHRFFEEPLVKHLAQALCVSSLGYGARFHIPKEKMHIVPFGVDTERFFSGKNTELRTQYGADDTSCIFLFVGGMDRAHAFKGIPVLIHAFAHINAPDAWLWLVGEGNMRAAYEALAKNAGIVSRVLFLGSVPFAQLPEVYRAADAHVLPSVNDAEAYGLVTAEAGASGIPSIVSDLPGARSLVEHEHTGLHVAPGKSTVLTEALNTLATNHEQRLRWGVNAREKMLRDASMRAEQEALAKAFV